MTLASYHLLHHALMCSARTFHATKITQYSEIMLYINDLQIAVNTEKHRFLWYYPPSNMQKTPTNCLVLEIWHTESTKKTIEKYPQLNKCLHDIFIKCIPNYIPNRIPNSFFNISAVAV